MEAAPVRSPRVSCRKQPTPTTGLIHTLFLRLLLCFRLFYAIPTLFYQKRFKIGLSPSLLLFACARFAWQSELAFFAGFFFFPSANSHVIVGKPEKYLYRVCEVNAFQASNRRPITTGGICVFVCFRACGDTNHSENPNFHH